MGTMVSMVIMRIMLIMIMMNMENMVITMKELPTAKTHLYLQDKDMERKVNRIVLTLLQLLSPAKKCVQKVMMVEETVWEDHETCDHSYDKRCHKSYTTTYQSQQEETVWEDHETCDHSH